MLQARPHVAPVGLSERMDTVQSAYQEVCGEAEKREMVKTVLGSGGLNKLNNKEKATSKGGEDKLQEEENIINYTRFPQW